MILLDYGIPGQRSGRTPVGASYDSHNSGDLRPGSVFLVRAPRFGGPALCGFVVCIIIT